VQQAVNVDYAGRMDWQITGVSKNDLFDVHVQPRHRQPGLAGYQVQLSLKPDAPPGSYKQELLLSTNDPSGPTVPVPFEITVQSALTVFPDTVRYTAVKVGAAAEYKVSIRGSGRPFRVTAVEGLGDGLSIAEPVPTGDARPVHIFTLKYNPTAAGNLSRKLTFKTDDGKGPYATIVVEGSASP